MATTNFTGFPPEAISFFRELGDNNNKPWFEAHKGDYEEYVKEPSFLFAETMADRLSEVAAGPAPAASPFRIYRDVRFSKDKRPYKTHLGIPFGDPAFKKGESPGFYFHLEGQRLMLGAGLHRFDRPFLGVYREAVDDEALGLRLASVVAELTGQGYEIWGETYKRVPRGYDEDHPRAELLRHSGLFAVLSSPHPPQLHTPELIDYCVAHYRAMAPLQHWLVELARG